MSARNCGSSSRRIRRRYTTACPTKMKTKVSAGALWIRHRTYDTLPEVNPRLECSPVQAPRTGRPLDLAGALSLRAAESGARHRRRPEAAVGATSTAPAADSDSRVEEFRDTLGERRH